ncbi:DUF1850 domain-containing protein [Paracoccus sp. Z330]|uniref:DUF1850 domain-containing protein n=1 Tax=Paracoccus onchidii TaxID=3017813 RepID=A0ABT4ZHH6_9RHOB|nr:DUF1850 domain-containing protein [Paracoccus onchidii]MDB6178547.1 DUF1850 domain-containing protein [Paracoccus onchidii]
MSNCLLVGAAILTLGRPEFQLHWQHSVEHVQWQENWQIVDSHLVLQEASVKGSGAGMDPGPGAVLRNGWWHWTPDLPPQSELVLAASGATDGGWTICDNLECHEFGQDAGAPLLLRPCPSHSPPN